MYLLCGIDIETNERLFFDAQGRVWTLRSPNKNFTTAYFAPTADSVMFRIVKIYDTIFTLQIAEFLSVPYQT